MRVAIVGASGKTGTELVRAALERGWSVSAVCREQSAAKLGAFAGRGGFELRTAEVVSDRAMLTEALAGCDAVIAVPITMKRLRAEALVEALILAAEANGVARAVFTAGEVTATPNAGERFSTRQRILLAIARPLARLVGSSVGGMIRATGMISKHSWSWTIVRAPTLTQGRAVGYRLCKLDDITGKDAMTRADYAACLLDVLSMPHTERKAITVTGGGEH